MTLEEFKEWIMTTELRYKYMLLDRMRQDCLYFLGYGKGGSQLWGTTIEHHIDCMLEIYDILEQKPERLTLKQIHKFKEEMEAWK